MMGAHRYGKPGHKYVQPAYNKSGLRWVAQGFEPAGKTVNLGTFDTPERGQMAVRLFNYWVSRGYCTDQIPRQPRTRDAI